MLDPKLDQPLDGLSGDLVQLVQFPLAGPELGIYSVDLVLRVSICLSEGQIGPSLISVGPLRDDLVLGSVECRFSC